MYGQIGRNDCYVKSRNGQKKNIVAIRLQIGQKVLLFSPVASFSAIAASLPTLFLLHFVVANVAFAPGDIELLSA